MVSLSWLEEIYMQGAAYYYVVEVIAPTTRGELGILWFAIYG